MDLSLVSIFTFWRRPKIALLDLRPLQCGYAGRGIGRCTLEVASRLKSLAESRDTGTRFQVYGLVMEGFANPLPEIPVLFSAPAWKRPWLWDQVCLPFLVFRHRVSVFHTFVALGPLPQISFPVLCRWRGIAEIQDWHMFSPDASPVEKFYRRTWRIRIQKAGLRWLRRVVVHSERIKAESVSQGIPADRITVIRLGGDHLDAVPAQSWPMENFILSVGDTPNKNLPFTQDFLALLRARFVHLNWVIVGNRENVLKQLGLTEGTLPEWIRILSEPSDGMLKACYRKALALSFPSTREGFGIPVIEAMRQGCPVLAADIEPMSSILNYAPALLPLDDREAWSQALSRLLHDESARKAASEAGLKQAAEYTWDHTAESTLLLYDIGSQTGVYPK